MFLFFRPRSKTRKAAKTAAKRPLALQWLEDRCVLSAFSVLNLNDSGAGSLRQAIVNADAAAGAEVITFNVSGTIGLTSGALPVITDQVSINGATAPGFAGSPVVEVNFNDFGGLQFNAGSAGSTLRSLSLVDASGAGVTLSGGGQTLIAGNYIGLALDGLTADGNGGNGLELDGSSSNMIGGATALDRNVISGNYANGIDVNGSSANQIEGNYIGTDATGAVGRGNTGDGILVTASSVGNVLGGSPGNVISANTANGVLINGSSTSNSLNGNIIGLTASGNAALGNSLDGVSIQNANYNLVGQSNPVTGVTYNNTSSVSATVSGWQGIRAADLPGQYLIAGTSGANGLLFNGTIAGVGTSYTVDYPGAATTSVYGPNDLGAGSVQLVGSYKNADASSAAVKVNGFIYQGTTAGLSQSANYKTIDYPGAEFNYVHSTMGGLAVGNYDSSIAHGSSGLPLGPGHAYIYNVAQGTFVTDVSYPGSKSNTAYGIWYNGGTSYTICGGWSPNPVNNFLNQNQPIGQAYLVDYNAATGKFSNWTTFSYPYGTNYVTHFEGISSVEKGVYTLNADSVQSGSTAPTQGSWVTVTRNTDGSFGPATWVNLNYTDVDPTTSITSSNAVYGNQVVGIVIGPSTFSFQATVNIGFQLSNVISGNGGNGISLYDASGNLIGMNYIGTNAGGTVSLGNAQNGILVTAGSTGNLIGGEATGGNDPTNAVFVRPPDGNLISGNGANGVLITGGATLNQLSGNFIGTTASGNAALGNTLDGVAIVSASGNSLIGCTFQQDPFVFYNVISGNGGNGINVTNSNNTTIQANFIGIGADNRTALGNALNGVLVTGSSIMTTMGGPIPLGNVDTANGLNGILVSGTASFFTSYNTFCGLAAFKTYTYLGNHGDGMLITSTGGNILIRTNVVTENGNDGIEIGGAATGVRVAGNLIGLDTNGNAAMGNANNGVEIDGTANNNIIGGPQATLNVIPHNAISANGGYGVAVDGSAYSNQINYSYIGTDLTGQAVFGNAKAGVYLGPGSRSTTVGSTDPNLVTVISGNLTNGVEMNGTSGNLVIGSRIGTDASGLLPLPNVANGVLITNSSNNVVGGTTNANGLGQKSYLSSSVVNVGNFIAFNGGYGVCVASGTSDAILTNSIHSNALVGINLGAGANLNQAAPVLTSVVIKPASITVAGHITSKPNTTFTIQFFANYLNSSSGNIYLGFLTVKTNAAGVGTFTYVGSPPPTGAGYITATATDPSNDTSKFSAALL